MGRPKAGLDLGGRSLLDRVIDTLTPLCREIIIVTRRPSEFLDYDLTIVRDLKPGQGPLGGLATGLLFAHYPWALTLACDLPFLSRDLLAHLIRKALATPAGPRAVVPRTQAGWEPLIAVYARNCLPRAQELLARDRHKLYELRSGGVRWEEVSEAELRSIDPGLTSFMNVNTPEDLLQARTRPPG